MVPCYGAKNQGHRTNGLGKRGCDGITHTHNTHTTHTHARTHAHELKECSTANTQPVETTTDYIHNHFERLLRLTLYGVFKSVPDLCFTNRLFAILGKAKYHYWPLPVRRIMTS